MNDLDIPRTPAACEEILIQTKALGFDMASQPRVGALLAVLAASKPRGRLLELGTGTGHGTAWLLSGMDVNSTLDSVDTDASVLALARAHLGTDSRVTFHVVDAAQFIERAPKAHFDLIYADAWPGKFSDLEPTLDLLRPGGVYVVDDLLPQPTWPEGHAPNVTALIEALEKRTDFVSVRLAWASGMVIAVRKPDE